MTMTDAQPGALLRKSAAVLHGDIVGFSRMVADDVEATVSAVEAARRITESCVREMSGELIDFVGDAFLAGSPPHPRPCARHARCVPDWGSSHPRVR